MIDSTVSLSNNIDLPPCSVFQQFSDDQKFGFINDLYRKLNNLRIVP
jgi:hypothetical protein